MAGGLGQLEGCSRWALARGKKVVVLWCYQCLTNCKLILHILLECFLSPHPWVFQVRKAASSLRFVGHGTTGSMVTLGMMPNCAGGDFNLLYSHYIDIATTCHWWPLCIDWWFQSSPTAVGGGRGTCQAGVAKGTLGAEGCTGASYGAQSQLSSHLKALGFKCLPWKRRSCRESFSNFVSFDQVGVVFLNSDVTFTKGWEWC